MFKERMSKTRWIFFVCKINTLKDSLKKFYSFFDQYLNYKSQFAIAGTEGLQDQGK